MKTLFLRNDDVRHMLDDILVYLTGQIIEAGLTISHAVEPANVTEEVVDWLRGMQADHPDRIEIIQHGYDHQLKTPSPVRGEFGGGRPYDEQFAEIRRGAEMMNDYFGEKWNRIFSFPYGAYDLNTLKALSECGFRTISTGIRFSSKRAVLNGVGRLLKRKTLLGRNIAYFNEAVPGFSNLRELPVVLNNSKKQTGPDTAIQRDCDELLAGWESLPGWLNCRGILCHHRFNSENDIDQLILFVCRLRDAGVNVSKIGDIHA